MKTFEKTWNPILRLIKFQDCARKSWNKKILRLIKKNLKIYQIPRLSGTYILFHLILHSNKKKVVRQFKKHATSQATDLFRGGQVSPLALAARTRGCQVLRRAGRLALPLLAAPPRLLEPIAQRRQPSPAAATPAAAALRQVEARSLALQRRARPAAAAVEDAAERHCWRALLFHGCPRFYPVTGIEVCSPAVRNFVGGKLLGFFYSCVSKRFNSVMFISK